MPNEGDTNARVKANDWEVNLSAHLSQHHWESLRNESNPVYVLETIILQHKVSLPEDLEYTNYPRSPQVKALMWLFSIPS